MCYLCVNSVIHITDIVHILHIYRVVKYRLHIINLLGVRYIFKKYRIDIIHLSDSADMYPICILYVSEVYPAVILIQSKLLLMLIITGKFIT